MKKEQNTVIPYTIFELKNHVEEELGSGKNSDFKLKVIVFYFYTSESNFLFHLTKLFEKRFSFF